jgi:hypothetical protein
MKFAIRLLNGYLKYYKRKLESTAATEFKMDYAGKIDELEKAIKILKEAKR